MQDILKIPVSERYETNYEALGHFGCKPVA